MSEPTEGITRSSACLRAKTVSPVDTTTPPAPGVAKGTTVRNASAATTDDVLEAHEKKGKYSFTAENSYSPVSSSKKVW